MDYDVDRQNFFRNSCELRVTGCVLRVVEFYDKNKAELR